jgi:hypothetical protein
MRLKALAEAVLVRNSQRNRCATDPEKDAQLQPVLMGKELRGLETVWRPTEAELQEGMREHLEERAAIQEYDGGLPRERAEAQARAALRVYEYRLKDYGDKGPWLILLAPDCGLAEVEQSLKNRFGAERVLAVRERGRFAPDH